MFAPFVVLRVCSILKMVLFTNVALVYAISRPQSSTHRRNCQRPRLSQSAGSACSGCIQSTLCAQSPSVAHPLLAAPIVKHIPRSARQHIAAELSSVLSQICSKSDNITNWSTLLNFGQTMLWVPPRGGYRHNLASDVNKRSISSAHADPAPNTTDYPHHYKKMNNDQSRSTAVMSKIEDGNVRAAGP